MSGSTILRNWRRIIGLSPADDGFVDARAMQRVLLREQARTDRTGDPFALLVFTVVEPRRPGESLDHLRRAIARRIRLTDEAGWLDRRSLAVVLPCTPVQGAWTLADDVCLALPPDMPLPVCRVYVYPTPRIAPGEGAGEVETDKTVDRNSVSAVESLLVRPMPRWKRALDIVGALAGLILAAPIMLAAALAIRLSSPGPLLFKQWRSGRGGQPFLCLKFRTMVVDAESQKRRLMALNEQDGPAFKIRRDPRVTRVGRFLRKASIDELPQLWNVLRGEMSLVGPRPLPVNEAEACRGWLRRRLDVVPGLTCIWQIHGRSRVSFADWVRMDLRYIRSRTVWHDLKLIAQTVPAVVFRRNGM